MRRTPTSTCCHCYTLAACVDVTDDYIEIPNRPRVVWNSTLPRDAVAGTRSRLAEVNTRTNHTSPFSTANRVAAREFTPSFV